MEQHHFNTYSSSYHSNERRTLYLALNRHGQPRKIQIPSTRSLGKLATYTKSLTQTVENDRIEKLITRVYGANYKRHGLKQLCELGKSLSDLPNIIKVKAKCPSASNINSNNSNINPNPNILNKKKKKKRKCKEGEIESGACRQIAHNINNLSTDNVNINSGNHSSIIAIKKNNKKNQTNQSPKLCNDCDQSPERINKKKTTKKNNNNNSNKKNISGKNNLKNSNSLKSSNHTISHVNKANIDENNTKRIKNQTKISNSTSTKNPTNSSLITEDTASTSEDSSTENEDLIIPSEIDELNLIADDNEDDFLLK